MSTTNTQHLEMLIRRELPSLTIDQAEELAAIVHQLADHFQPECIFVFGSRARDDANADSDVDLLVVVHESDEPAYRREQEAYGVIQRQFLFPLDILVVTSDEFHERLQNPATLPATVLREGKVVYAA